MITINQLDALNSYVAINNISKQPVSKQCALSIFNLKRELKKQLDFQEEQEKDICSKLNINVDSNGNLLFTNETQQEEFIKERNDVYNVQVNIDADPIDLRNEDIKISGDDIGTLQPFIII